jgi:hypothetical protein
MNSEICKRSNIKNIVTVAVSSENGMVLWQEWASQDGHKVLQ